MRTNPTPIPSVFRLCHSVSWPVIPELSCREVGSCSDEQFCGYKWMMTWNSNPAVKCSPECRISSKRWYMRVCPQLNTKSNLVEWFYPTWRKKMMKSLLSGQSIYSPTHQNKPLILTLSIIGFVRALSLLLLVKCMRILLNLDMNSDDLQQMLFLELVFTLWNAFNACR